MSGVGGYLPILILATFLCQILTVQGTVDGSCDISELPFDKLKCQDIKNDPVKPVNGAVSSGHICVYKCSRNQQQTWAHCNNGQWNGEPEKCLENPSSIIHHRPRRWGRFFRRVFRAIKCVFARCSKGPRGDSTPPKLTCPPDQNRNGDPFQTHAKATWVTPTALDSRDGTVTVYQSTSRRSGFPISEPGASIGFYAKDKSGNMAKCSFRINVKVIRCPRLQRMTDGYAICHRSDDMVLSSYCRFGCYEGHELIGPSYAQCKLTGRWSSWTLQQPSCRKHSCDPLLPSSPLLSITRTNGDLFRSIATFSCVSGYDVPTGVRRAAVCGVDKTWSSTVPNCVDIEPPSFKPFPSSKTFYIARNDNTVAVYWQGPEVEDNSGDTLAAEQKNTWPNQGDALAVGTYTVTYTATDSEGNIARPLNFKITVKEIRCFHVYPTPYTSVICTGNRLGSTCRFNCSDGAKLNASSSVTSCDREGSPPYGVWDWGTQQPFCELPKNCQLPSAPDNGALACDYWLGGRFCQPQCQVGYDISARSTYTDLLICNDDGSHNWQLPLPNCMPSSSSGGTRRTVEVVFFTGSCSDETTQIEIKQNFIKKLVSTSFSHGCGSSPKCSWRNVQVICGNTNGKRSTGITISFEIAMNSTAMNEEEYYNQYMEYASLIETLKVDVTSGTLTLQMNDNTTMKAAEMLMGDIGLQCVENTVASTKTFSCVECQSGSYYDATTEECVLCPVGQYQTEPRKSTCIQCPYGTSTATTGSSNQTQCQASCPPGSWSPSSLPPCTPCDVGYYQSEFGATGCIACPGNKITKIDNSSLEMECVDFDVYFPDNQTAGVLLSNKEAVPVIGYTAVWWQQCSSDCTGEVFVLKNETGAKSLSMTFASTMTISVEGQTISSGLAPPDDRGWHVFTLKRKHTFLECFMDMSLLVNMTGLAEQTVIGGVTQLGGISFEGTISQFNIFTESIPLATDKCSNDMSGDVISWRSILNATMNDAFIQIPSVCDDVNECDSSPCFRGNCTDDYNSYQCKCEVGFTGNDCDVDLDDCEMNSCQNNATCQDSVNNYTCQCLPNFTGALCEIAMVDGDWNEYSNWTECSVTCGNGTQIRFRACDNPAPDNGGAECFGDSNETKVCEQESCPVCGELVPPINGSLKCINDGVDNVCELECDVGYVTDIPIPDNYSCGNSTFDQWDFKLETNVFSRLPSCVETIDPDDMRATRTSYYHGLDCNTLSTNTDTRIAVIGKLGAVVESLTGVKNNDCKEDQKYINTCENRRRRDTSSESAAYTIVLHCDSKSKGASECYEILTQAVIGLESLEEQGEMNVVINGIEYTINVSLSEADTSLNCPTGMVEVLSYCVPCGPGRYYSEDECALCDFGFYQDATQQTSCKACPTATSTEGTGSISAAECTVVLPVEDSVIDSSVLAVGVIAGIVAGVALFVLAVAICTAVRLKKSKKKISDSTLFQRPSALHKGLTRESTTASVMSITDIDSYYPTRTDTTAKTRWNSSSLKDDDCMLEYQSPLFPKGHLIPPLTTEAPHLIHMTPLPDNQAPFFSRQQTQRIGSMPPITGQVDTSISTIDILPIGN
ncbi:sushi, von Willebrand factor type A, EGF and pentraxin domain-containing protein 1-like [Mizuhopecten yessoensis]|uniref:Sushi, von Willebrand factor type A, EGF and pentraxin domain-containing protein 1 n=1 Tax=Mizuhopecten yessoensis TaxID=6573 RepID=A0A210QRU8_MIZYE|nr:sushi, von Willebrand factor type A, EGF and pentraxin domain-containing protein 1-like [Mizuhopecten yessoensis]OWF51465.1 Sushi, von Willebrand factor type A, EGF and pentraxin domain-containing protein 1 [Mizuhopecten yessoensis]